MPTPYEQRFNYYMAARDHLVGQYQANMDIASQGKVFPLPKYPSTEEIFSLAEEIKAFAEKK